MNEINKHINWSALWDQEVCLDTVSDNAELYREIIMDFKEKRI